MIKNEKLKKFLVSLKDTFIFIVAILSIMLASTLGYVVGNYYNSRDHKEINRKYSSVSPSGNLVSSLEDWSTYVSSSISSGSVINSYEFEDDHINFVLTFNNVTNVNGQFVFDINFRSNITFNYLLGGIYFKSDVYQDKVTDSFNSSFKTNGLDNPSVNIFGYRYNSDMVNYLLLTDGDDLFNSDITLKFQYISDTPMNGVVNLTAYFEFYSFDHEVDSSYNKGYIAGYDKGVNDSSNPYYGFDNSYFDLYYETNTGDTQYVFENRSISTTNTNNYDVTDYVFNALSEWHSEQNGSEDDLIYLYLYDFKYFDSSYYKISVTGFTRVDVTYNRGEIQVIDIGDPSSTNELDLLLDKEVTDILLYVNAQYVNIPKYNVNFSYYNTYENGYKTGYNQGQINGKNDVINNPSNYDLYNKTQLDYSYNNGYSQGYDKGVLEGEGLGERGFLTMFNAILNAPFNILNGLLNFEIFGINLFNLVSFILTLGLIIFLFALFGGKFGRK